MKFCCPFDCAVVLLKSSRWERNPSNFMPFRISILVCCSLIFGCGSPKPYDIRAVVRLDGKPFVEAEVSLVSSKEGTKSAFGMTDAEGNVVFRTEERDGVLPGIYTVIVSKTAEEKRLSNNEIRALAEMGIRYEINMVELAPEKYTRNETSDLTIKVGYWSSKNFVFDLHSVNPPL